MKGFIIDLDGTVYQGNELIDGAKEFIETLQAREIPYLFATNNSQYTPEMIADRINKMGIAVQEEKIVTSALAAAAYLKEEKKYTKVAVIGAEGLHEAIEAAEFEITNHSPDVVVQGVDQTFTYEKLRRATEQLQGGADYILTNPDLLIPVENGYLPGAGSLSAAIQAASGSSPTIIGKPSSIMMKFAIDKLDIERETICVAGDNLLTDIQAGWKAGCQTAWMMTGIGREQFANHLLEQQEFKPDMVCENLNELLD